MRKAEVVPLECVVRGYLAGSGWKEYQQSQSVVRASSCRRGSGAQQLPEPIFTPATKAETGHDENVDIGFMADKIGSEVASDLRKRSLDVYQRAARYAADARDHPGGYEIRMGPAQDGTIILIDEVLTPDSRAIGSDVYRPDRRHVVRQTIRPRLAGNHLVGQTERPACFAGQRRPENRGQISGSV